MTRADGEDGSEAALKDIEPARNQAVRVRGPDPETAPTPLGAAQVTAKALRAARRRALLKFLFTRLVHAAGLVVAVIIVNFALIKAAPGDPVQLFTPPGGASPAYLAHLRAELGLNQSTVSQFRSYFYNAIHLNFGESLQYRTSVMSLIRGRVAATLLLTGTGLFISSVLGILLGIESLRFRRIGAMTTVATIAATSIPVFFFGQLLLYVFSLHLGWLPSQGETNVLASEQGLQQIADVFRHLILPELAYVAFPLALVLRVTRAKVRETASADFVLMARSKGMKEARVMYRHVLPNALPPVIAAIAYNVGFLLAGAVLVETVFDWPGMGQLLANAVLALDYPVLLGIFTITAVMVIAAYTLADVTCALLDPRLAVMTVHSKVRDQSVRFSFIRRAAGPHGTGDVS